MRRDDHPVEICAGSEHVPRVRSLLRAGYPAPITVVVTPFPRASRLLTQRRPDGGEWRRGVVLSTDPSTSEAALLIAAGADAYVTRIGDLGDAVTSVANGETWYAPVAATAVCRLARLWTSRDADRLAAVARASAAGTPWLLACRSVGVARTGEMLDRLRQAL